MSRRWRPRLRKGRARNRRFDIADISRKLEDHQPSAYKDQRKEIGLESVRDAKVQ